ncbi:MAG: hypothetical protein AAF721_14950 [Myxococcota bacterium]
MVADQNASGIWLASVWLVACAPSQPAVSVEPPQVRQPTPEACAAWAERNADVTERRIVAGETEFMNADADTVEEFRAERPEWVNGWALQCGEHFSPGTLQCFDDAADDETWAACEMPE